MVFQELNTLEANVLQPNLLETNTLVGSDNMSVTIAVLGKRYKLWRSRARRIFYFILMINFLIYLVTNMLPHPLWVNSVIVGFILMGLIISLIGEKSTKEK